MNRFGFIHSGAMMEFEVVDKVDDILPDFVRGGGAHSRRRASGRAGNRQANVIFSGESAPADEFTQSAQA